MTVLEILSAPGSAAHGTITTHLKQLGLEHFLTGRDFHSISLKQVMDAKDSALANYQGLVALLRQFTGQDPAGSPATGTLPPLAIKVFDYPTFPIVETLGLIPEHCDSSGPYPIYSLKPIDPFWISGAMVGDTGLEMCSRVGIHWQRVPAFDSSMARIRKGAARRVAASKRKKRMP